ncbi:putative RNA-binding protein [Trypanosoma vivax]|uniref:Putative RNA-binding protein n=1 Tax=Trypanosoma vivax (strain Y486) TaxID=1055687 RepID=G0U3L6_TRYVY|nr:putative RNA-binding protein [Trypanosoma vivax]CCC50873.1 putative RNA-binding protein [Trypanosoma vivax Y486]
MHIERSSMTCSHEGDEADRGVNNGNVLFVGNLPFQTPWQHVKDHFRGAGKVRYTDLIADHMGRPKGSALVTMASSSAAQRAILLYNETDFEGRRLIVRLFDDGPRPQLVQRDMMPQYDRQAQHQPQPHQQHHQLQQQPQSQPLQQRFRGYTGGDTSHFNSGNNFVRAGNGGGGYANRTGNVPGADDGNMGNFNDVAEVVPKPRSQQVNEAGRKLFVSNLPFDCTSAALRDTFQQVGNVERAEIIVGRNGKSRGMGIVVMRSEDEASLAIDEFDGIEMASRAMHVRFDNKVSS